MIYLEKMRNKLEMYIENKLFRIVLKILKLIVWFMKCNEKHGKK